MYDLYSYDFVLLFLFYLHFVVFGLCTMVWDLLWNMFNESKVWKINGVSEGYDLFVNSIPAFTWQDNHEKLQRG
jgi:hypothetical protein